MAEELLIKQLDIAKNIDEKELALQIKNIGFKCLRCCECCKDSYGDSTVAVFPFEIRNIQKRTGLDWLDIAKPHTCGDYDAEGTLHAFGWVLRKKGKCIFLKNNCCEIYDCKPMICDTYPFFIEDGHLEICKCRGLGSYISPEKSRLIAGRIKDRYVKEIEDMMIFFNRFKNFNQKFRVNIGDSEKNGFCIVHTSEESCMIKLDELPVL